MAEGEADPVRRRAGTEWFFRGAAGSSKRDIWEWWQQRRARYNEDLLIVGFVSGLLVLIVGSGAVEPGVDFVEPFAMIIGSLVYVILANVAYTAGPVLDMIAYQGAPRRHLLKAGYLFTLVVTALPGVWAVVAWLLTVVSGAKLK